MSRLGNHNWNGQRVNVGWGDVTQALLNDYGDPGIQGGGAYRVRVGDQDVLTSIITRPQWLDLACPLTPGNFPAAMGARLVWDRHGRTASDCCRWLTGGS